MFAADIFDAHLMWDAATGAPGESRDASQSNAPNRQMMDAPRRFA
jgi:hypothetical protein